MSIFLGEDQITAIEREKQIKSGAFTIYPQQGRVCKNDVEIDLAIPGLAVSDIVVAAPGCSRKIDTCVNKFSNELNFGGYPYIPIKNPMGAGTPIW